MVDNASEQSGIKASNEYPILRGALCSYDDSTIGMNNEYGGGGGGGKKILCVETFPFLFFYHNRKGGV